MKKLDGYEQAEARTGEYEQLPVGGYVCKILQVKAEEPEPDAGKSYDVLLRIGFDIVEGEHAGYFKRQFERKVALNPNAKWPGMYYQTAKGGEAAGYFKGFITAIEQSNPGYKWDWDERKLKGKLFGGVFGEEEYVGNDGNIRASVKCVWVRSADKIRNGDFTIPEKKTVSGKSRSRGASLADTGQVCEVCGKPLVECTCGDDLPF